MNKSDLRQRILTRLGAPVINIELAPEQMDLYIQDAVDKFIEVHYDGLDTGVIFVNIVTDQAEYTLPGNVHSVMEIMNSNAGIVDEPLLVNPYRYSGNYYVGDYGQGYSTHFSYLDVELYNQNFATWQNYSSQGKEEMFQYNSTTGILKLFVTPKEDKTMALKIHSAPATFDTLYENSWLQKYSTALCQIAWAQNISKYEGGTLPGGVSLNFTQILAEGKEAKEALELELYERYQEPIDFFFG